MSATATARLSRLLAMVPWLLRRQGVPLEEAARHFGISTDELVADLELLFVCGTPGHLPDDLIEADWESGRVYLDNADPIARPLRLGVDEAVALLVGLRTLARVPGLHDREALDSALAKLSAAAGDAASGVADSVSVDLARGAQGETLAAVREALSRRRRLHLTYLVPSRDETSRRDVDPMRLVSVAGHWYLEAWCHRAEDVRLFRLDRVVEVQVLDVDGTPPAGAVARDTDEQLFRPSPDDLSVVLDLAPGSRWVAEYYPVESVRELGEGRLRVTLRTAHPDWAPRLVLRLGGGARIVGPQDAVDRLVEVTSRALAGYDGPDLSGG